MVLPFCLCMPTTTQILSKFFLHALLQLQEVLRTLHSHLGAQVPAEASAALGVLVALARQHTAQLMRYAAFLTNILDYIDGYTDQQVHQARAGEGWVGQAVHSDQGGRLSWLATTYLLLCVLESV